MLMKSSFYRQIPDRVGAKGLTSRVAYSDQIRVAKRYWERFMGWMGRRNFAPGEGLLFPDCNSVHTYFMFLPIDVVFLKEAQAQAGLPYTLTISSLRREVRPWRLLPLYDFHAHHTLELPAGTANAWGLQEGDQLCID
jgi:uncharacterized membrane protein (UPF0127 family)